MSKFWVLSIFTFLFSSILAFALTSYATYAQEDKSGQTNASNTDSIVSQPDSTSSPSAADSIPDSAEYSTKPNADDVSTNSDSQNTVSDNSFIISDLNPPEGKSDTSSNSSGSQDDGQTTDDGSGIVVAIDESSIGTPSSDNSSDTISKGGTSPQPSTIEPMSQSETSSGNAEQTTDTDKSNQSSSSFPSGTVTADNQDTIQDGNSVSSSIDGNITSQSSLGLQSSSLTTDTLSSTNQSSSGLSSTIANQSGSSGASTTANQSSSGSTSTTAINETSSPSEVSSSTFVTSNISSMSPLYEGASVQAETTNPNIIVQPISPGSEQEINFGDVSNTENTTATISLDKSSYAPGDTAKVTINDQDANLDANVINTVQVNIASASDPTGIIVTLRETTPDSGRFEGTFGIADSDSTGDSLKVDPSSGDNIRISYDASHPRATVIITGVAQSGIVQIEEVLVRDSASTLTAIGVELRLADGANLEAPTDPLVREICNTANGVANSPVETCGGKITIKMSYANIPLTFERSPIVSDDGNSVELLDPETVSPSELTIYQKVGNIWIDLGPVTVDEKTKTVTAISPFGPGIFIIGSITPVDPPDQCNGDCQGGGGGGGLALPGSGVVLDFIAGVVESQPPSNPPSNPPSSLNPILDLESDTNLTTSSFSTSSGNSIIDSHPSIQTLAESGIPLVSSSEGKRNDNITISIPGVGNVTLNYVRLAPGENLTASTLNTPSELEALNITKARNSTQLTLSTLNNTRYSIISTVFMIGPNDARVNGTITVSIPYNNTSLSMHVGEDVRMFRYTGSAWEDVTSTPSGNLNSVTGTLSSVGPIVAGVKSTIP